MLLIAAFRDRRGPCSWSTDWPDQRLSRLPRTLRKSAPSRLRSEMPSVTPRTPIGPGRSVARVLVAPRPSQSGISFGGSIETSLLRCRAGIGGAARDMGGQLGACGSTSAAPIAFTAHAHCRESPRADANDLSQSMRIGDSLSGGLAFDHAAHRTYTAARWHP